MHLTGNKAVESQNLYGYLNNKKGTILVIHGSAMSATTFAQRGGPTFPFQLYDRGYDVWLASMRGTEDTLC